MFFIELNEFVDSVFVIAEHLDKKGIKKNITHIKIQKIIYVIYTYFLIFKNKKIMKLDFQAWKWGPVIYELWNRFKDFGSNQIEVQTEMSIESLKENLGEDFNMYYKICAFLLKIDAWELVEICHKETPWNKLYIPMKNIKIDDAWILKDNQEYKHDFFEMMHGIIK